MYLQTPSIPANVAFVVVVVAAAIIIPIVAVATAP